MTNRKPHISEEDFKRYLANKMTNAERNAFEKVLQANPFEADALKGFENFSTSNIESDIEELNSKIKKKKRKNRIPYFAAAAAILLLVTAGILWMQLDNQNPLPETSEVKHKIDIQPEKEIEKSKSVITLKKDQVLPKEINKTQKPAPVKNTAAKKSNPELKSINKQAEANNDFNEKGEINAIKTSEKIELKKVRRIKSEESGAYEAPAMRERTAQTLSIHGNKFISGQVISADDKMPIAGATIIEKGTNNGIVTDVNGQFQLPLENDSSPTIVASFIGMETNEFKPSDDSNIVRLEPDEIAFSEVVVVGYGTQKKSNVTGITEKGTNNVGYIKPKPILGAKAYKKYLYDNASLPSNYDKNKVSLKIILSLNKDGIIDSINYKGAYSDLFKKAQKLIMEGPKWNPGYENGQSINTNVNVKIVFRKRDK